MKQQLLRSIIIATILVPVFAYAEEKTASSTQKIENNSYITCKKSALERKNNLIERALKDYKKEVETATKKTYRDIERMKWMIYSSYRTESKRILEEQKSTMSAIQASTTQARKTALATWKAEDALCDYYHNKTVASSTPQKENKGKKR